VAQWIKIVFGRYSGSDPAEELTTLP